jgi:hypothetical protein
MRDRALLPVQPVFRRCLPQPVVAVGSLLTLETNPLHLHPHTHTLANATGPLVYAQAVAGQEHPPVGVPARDRSGYSGIHPQLHVIPGCRTVAVRARRHVKLLRSCRKALLASYLLVIRLLVSVNVGGQQRRHCAQDELQHSSVPVTYHPLIHDSLENNTPCVPRSSTAQ